MSEQRRGWWKSYLNDLGGYYQGFSNNNDNGCLVFVEWETDN